MEAQTYYPSYSGGRGQENGGSRPALSKNLRPFLKDSKKEQEGRAQVVKHLPNKVKT
jgi:hypothetical protein